MISQVYITEDFLADNVYLLKIKSNSLLYQEMPFCKTVCQTKDQKQTAFINILNDGATVFCFENADIEEIEMFLMFSGVKNVFCNEIFAKSSQKYAFKTSDLLRFANSNDLENQEFNKTFYPDYKSVYDLLIKDFCLPDYNEFVSDLSFRIKHNKARIIQAETGVVFTGWEDETSAIISAISVYITKREKQQGSLLLNSLLFDLKQDKKKNIFVYCEQNITPFYLKNGFELEENIYIGKVK